MESKTILITGCSSGQGRDLAENLTKAGYRVAATARNPEDLTGLSAELKLKLDVTDEPSIQIAVSKVIEKFGKIDILINNAGFAIRSTIEEAPEELLREMFEVNVFGNLRMVRAVAPHMRSRKSGMIITIGSLAGKVSIPVNGNYSMTKFALEALNDALRLELGLFGIKVVLIEPGNIHTKFKENAVS
ncbi:MAG TPA: SDR family oxidoreductase, partial [Bacillota bacterium]|nr:SDR family oxidoreductase [Bacillota bacterium]